MDNKNEKTFADLFSSSSNKDDTSNKSFSDMLNNSEEEKTPITFDSLFDKISEQDELNLTNSNELVEITETINETEFEQRETQDSVDFSNIFTKNIDSENLNNEEQDNSKIKEKEEGISQEEVELKIENDNIESINEKSNEIQEIKEEIEELEPVIEEENNKIEFNPFIEASTEKEEKTSIDNNVEEQNNFFFQNDNKENIDESITNEFENNDRIQEIEVKNEGNENNNEFKTFNNEFNPFIEETTKQEEVKEFEGNQENSLDNSKNEEQNNINIEINPLKEENTIESNLEKQQNNTENKIEETPTDNEQNNINIEFNPFIGEVNEKTELIQTNENPFINNEKEEVKEQENVTQKSTSPFFEEEKTTEGNPFFENQINLIENQAPNTPSSNIDLTKSKHYIVKIVKKKEPFIKFIMGVLSYALFIWLLLIGITLLIYVLDIKIRAAKGDYSAPTFNAYVVLTGSMLPEIQVRDVVVTKKVDAEKLKEGDVITFASADSRFLGTIITHRIIKKNPPSGTEGYTFQTRGDNNNVADSALVPENNIYGKVILKIPKLGFLQEFLASDGGWIIVILIPCLTVISYDTVKLIKGLKRKKYKNIKVQK